MRKIVEAERPHRFPKAARLTSCSTKNSPSVMQLLVPGFGTIRNKRIALQCKNAFHSFHFVELIAIMAHSEPDHFGETIRKAREALGLSLQGAADRLGWPKTTLWRLESGDTKITAHRLATIAAAYGYSISRMFAGALARTPAQTDLDGVGDVIEHVETIVQQRRLRPSPHQVRVAVVEVWRLETQRLAEADGVGFDPERYDGLVREIFGADEKTAR